MTMFESKAHFLSYGATDQETLRDLRDSYTGLLVPATIAAWQRKGTGGFVLTLSATDEAKPYTIDPRFPLFQQGLVEPKQSHSALAEIFNDLDLVVESHPRPADFTSDRIGRIASAWVDFNTGYAETEGGSFGKYARRLGRVGSALKLNDASKPERILAPYFVASDPDDPWWALSVELYEATVKAADGQMPVTRVVATGDAAGLKRLLPLVDEDECAVWVSGLNEYDARAIDLSRYRSAIASEADNGLKLFALYGGPFSVLLNSAGLLGASHGVGFSEHRAWHELPSSGAAPPRFYLRAIHRYVSLDLAQQLWQRDPDLTECPCSECGPGGPAAMDYHALMKHSVRCRQDEIDAWHGISPEDAAQELEDSFYAFEERVEAAGLPAPIRNRALRQAEHLHVWSVAILP